MRLAASVITAVCVGALVGLAGMGGVRAAEETPAQMEGVDIVEHLGSTPPLDLTFRNEAGETVPLSTYVKGDKPVILTLVYYNCPMLCNMILNGLVEGMRGIEWTPGEDYRVVTVSIDARETPELAQEKKANYLAQLGKPEAAEGWHFLVGERENIKKLAEAVGFGFRYDADRMEYAHGAAIFLMSPEGKLTRYLYGIQFPPKQLKLALVEAGEGKLGSALDRFVLRCYHYDPASRKYGVYIWGIMRTGGLLTVLLVGLMLFIFWRRERRRGQATFGDPDEARDTQGGASGGPDQGLRSGLNG